MCNQVIIKFFVAVVGVMCCKAASHVTSSLVNIFMQILITVHLVSHHIQHCTICMIKAHQLVLSEQDKQRRTFFSVFYLCINGGSLLSTIITPILRAQECGIKSKESCYSLAFGVPAALMVVSLLVFIVGSGLYYKDEPQGNIMVDVCKCIGFAIKNRYRHRSKQYPKRQHWMDWADEKYDKLLIAQIKMVLRVLFLYIPLPMFWTLFDQKGSRWTLQATTMDGNFGALIVQPDQMQTVNPILILTLVPIMDFCIYPLIKKCGLDFTPLKRMTVGMFMASIAFVCAAVVQLEIDKTLPNFPSTTQGQLKLLNMGNNPVTVRLPGNEPQDLPASLDYFTFESEQINVSISSPEVTRNISLSMGERQTLLIPSDLTDEWLQTEDLTSKPKQGQNAVRFVNGMNTVVNVSTPSVYFGLIEPLYYTNYSLIKNGEHTFTLWNDAQKCDFTMTFRFGSAYTFFINSNLFSDVSYTHGFLCFVNFGHMSKIACHLIRDILCVAVDNPIKYIITLYTFEDFRFK
uniref:Solute carrier family 15 member 1-like n=1 Tax=Acanthochromis polyacanthus TaxID=80966 RepID=A0A3Q1HQA5_9TELE